MGIVKGNLVESFFFTTGFLMQYLQHLKDEIKKIIMAKIHKGFEGSPLCYALSFAPPDHHSLIHLTACVTLVCFVLFQVQFLSSFLRLFFNQRQ